MSELEEFEEAMARRRRFWDGVTSTGRFIGIMVLVIAGAAWVLMNMSTAIDCADKVCPPGQTSEVVRDAWSGAWRCTCVFK